MRKQCKRKRIQKQGILTKADKEAIINLKNIKKQPEGETHKSST